MQDSANAACQHRPAPNITCRLLHNIEQNFCNKGWQHVCLLSGHFSPAPSSLRLQPLRCDCLPLLSACHEGQLGKRALAFKSNRTPSSITKDLKMTPGGPKKGLCGEVLEPLWVKLFCQISGVLFGRKTGPPKQGRAERSWNLSGP